MISASGTFEYHAVVTEESFVPSGSVFLRARAHLRPDTETLVGPNPEIRLVREQLVVWAQSSRLALLERAIFNVGDSLLRSIQPDDELYATRSGCGGLGVSVLRGGELVIGLGAVSLAPLGESVAVRRHPNLERGAFDPDETWLEMHVGDDCRRLAPREITLLGGYAAYVDDPWLLGDPGDDESAAVFPQGDETLTNAAVRSAIIIAYSGTEFTSWDGRPISS